MKKYNLLLLAVLLATFACQKPASDPNPVKPGNAEKFAVNFKVSGFSQVIVDNARSADTTVLQNVRKLIYVAFDANTGQVVSRQNKIAGDTTFGEFRDSLPTGRYVVTVTGIKDTTGAEIATDPLGVYIVYPGTDLFYKRTIISVSGSADENMTLDRVVSRLMYQFKGRIPYNARKISIWPHYLDDVYGISPFLDFYTGSNLASQHYHYAPYYYSIPDSLIGHDGLTLNTYLMNPSGTQSTDVEISVTDSTGKVISSKAIYSVMIENNKTTLLSGYIFDSIPASGGVQVKVNPNWSTDTIKAEF